MKPESLLLTRSGAGASGIHLIMQGQLVVKNAKAIKEELLSALNNSQNLQLVLNNIIKIDLAVLQLLIASQKMAARLQIKLSFEIEFTDQIKLVMYNSGLEKYFLPAK